MKQKTTLTAGCLSAALMCAPAFGSDFQGRWYFGLGGGVSKLEPDTDNSQYDLDDTEDTSARIVIGRDLTNRLSAELYLADLGEVTFKPSATAVNPVANPYVGYKVGGLHLLAYLFNSDGSDGRHYRDSFSLFAKIGLGTMDNDSNVDYERLEDLHLSLGFGMEGLIASGVSWRFDIDGYDVDATQASLSLIKRFGAVSAPGASAAPVSDTVAAMADAKIDKVMGDVEPAITMAEESSPELVAEPVETADPVIETPVIETVVAAIEAVNQTTDLSTADSDGDGVVDTADRCAGTEDGLAVDVRGCSFSGIIEGLYFDRGSDSLNGSAEAILDNIVLELRRFPNVVLEVQAHTDNRGKAVDNLALSQRRAESVANFMVGRGISANRLRARGFGESRPAFRNATEEGRRRNRRVVFQTVEKLQ